MKEPARLIDTSTDPELRRLLRAGRSETPSDQALHRTLRAAAAGAGIAACSLAAAAESAAGATAIGTTQASLTTVGVGTGLSASTAGASASVGGVGAKLVVATGVAKWAGLGALTAASVVLSPKAVDWVQQSYQPHAVHSVATKRIERNGARFEAERSDSIEGLVATEVGSKATPLPPTPAVAFEPAPGASSEVSPRADSKAPAAPRPNALSAASRESMSARTAAPTRERLSAPDEFTTGQVDAEFAEQVKSVEQARRAITQADAASGLALLADYEKRFTRAQLLPEVLLLRLEAFEQLGRTREAQAVARRMLQRGATGVHAERARATLQQ